MALAARTVNIRSWVSVKWIPLWHEWNTLMHVWVVRHDSPLRHDSAEEEREHAREWLIEPRNQP
jgi:hypothetical protein